MTRRFEFVGGTSAKFWEVHVSGVGVTITFGRIGTEGQVLTKSFATAAAATKYAEKQVSAKLAKGYVECRSQVSA
ncbi:MAG: WGR domain-containing protein [Planctomycetaceae bacterium]|nr:WGR domain-containing protein [Planctomycetaceae bacterium]